EQLLERARKQGVMIHAQRSPTKNFWISAGAGVQSGVAFNYVVWVSEQTAVELYIDVGDQGKNKQIFDSLIAKKNEIEKAFGSALSWERLDEKRGSRVRRTLTLGGLTEEAKWPEIQDAMIKAMDKLSRALKPYLART